jgi:hypothetical protein
MNQQEDESSGQPPDPFDKDLEALRLSLSIPHLFLSQEIRLQRFLQQTKETEDKSGLQQLQNLIYWQILQECADAETKEDAMKKELRKAWLLQTTQELSKVVHQQEPNPDLPAWQAVLARAILLSFQKEMTTAKDIDDIDKDIASICQQLVAHSVSTQDLPADVLQAVQGEYKSAATFDTTIKEIKEMLANIRKTQEEIDILSDKTRKAFAALREV